jgi:hypothetical protein
MKIWGYKFNGYNYYNWFGVILAFILGIVMDYHTPLGKSLSTNQCKPFKGLPEGDVREHPIIMP